MTVPVYGLFPFCFLLPSQPGWAVARLRHSEPDQLALDPFRLLLGRKGHFKVEQGETLTHRFRECSEDLRGWLEQKPWCRADASREARGLGRQTAQSLLPTGEIFVDP